MNNDKLIYDKITIIKKIYPDFNWKIYRDLNPYLQIIGLKTEDDYTNNFILEGRYKGRIYKEEQKKKYSFHVLIATIGKISILKMLELLNNQLTEIDFLTIVFDGYDKSKNIDIIQKYCSNFICKVNIIVEKKNLGYWGHGIRNKYKKLEGDFIYHIDDDDIIFNDTFDTIRKYCTDINMIYIFKIILENNKIIWKTPKIELNHISTQSGVIPRELNKKGYWELKYGGDYNFYKSICNDNNTIFIDKVIYKKK
jgi:hypothetical protein